MVSENIFGAVIFGFIRFVASVVLAVVSVYFGVKAFDRLTEGIEEMDELKKGNAAVGLVIAAVILTIAAIARTGIFAFASGIQSFYPVDLIIFLGVVNLVKLAFGLIVGVITVFIAFNLLGRLTEKIDEISELKKENIAIAILVAGVLLSVALVVDASLESLLNSPSLNGCTIAKEFSANALKIDTANCIVEASAAAPLLPAATPAGNGK